VSDLITSLPNYSRITARLDHERNRGNAVAIAVSNQTRKRYHRKNIQMSEFDKDRRNKKKMIINESIRYVLYLTKSFKCFE
jgi:hypothetical protein